MGLSVMNRQAHTVVKAAERLAAAIGMALLVVGCTPDRLLQSAASTDTGIDPEWRQIAVGTTTRDFLLHVPAKVASSPTPVALVIMLHGTGGSPADLRITTGMSSVADASGFIVVYAAGSHGQYSLYPSDWNAGGACCGAAARENVDDLAYLREIISTVSAQYSVDERRVYIAGFSAGGRMAYHAACQLSSLIAGIAVVSGSLVDDECAPSSAVALLAVHGTADEIVPYSDPADTPPPSPVPADASALPASVQFWVAANGCASGRVAAVQVSTDVLQDAFSNCAGADVTAYVIDGGVHGWPGQLDTDPASPMAELNTTQVVASFFAAHVRKP
jgi:polyhydroxybutyrate depolymerase